MRNKIILCILSIVLAASLAIISACAAPAPAPAPALGPAPAPEVITWRLQSMFSAGYQWEITPHRFAERVEKASGGRLVIEPYAAGALIPTFEGLDSVGKGVIEIAHIGAIYWTGMLPFTTLSWGAPMTLGADFNEYEYMWNEMGMLELAREEYAKYNVHFVGPIYATPYGGTMSPKPIKSVDEWDGIKIRSFGFSGDLWKAFGASIVSVPPGEMYTALATGTIDAAHWAGPHEFHAMKTDEVAKYYLLPPIIGLIANEIFVNMDKWNELPEDLQEIVTVAAKVGSAESAALTSGLNAIAEQEMRAAGITFNTLSDSDLARLKAKATEIMDEKAKVDAGSARAVEIIRKAMSIYGH